MICVHLLPSHDSRFSAKHYRPTNGHNPTRLIWHYSPSIIKLAMAPALVRKVPYKA